jgi:two-component system chemotaxis sensor kinase CheA
MIDKFKQTFLEEARDILVELEAALLELNENRGDKELVGRAFRALHTIKGSGAMFGFDQLAAFTHNLENAFDEVRNGKLEVSDELINLSLAAMDHIKTMLDEACGGAAADRAVAAAILAKVAKLTAGGAEEKSPGQAPPEAPTGASPLSASPISTSPTLVEREWRLHFAPAADLLRTGANPLLLLRELGQMGRLRVTASLAAMPPLAELDAERCYLAWDGVLATTAPREAIADVFIFAMESCELSIEPMGTEPVNLDSLNLDPPAGAAEANAVTAVSLAVEQDTARLAPEAQPAKPREWTRRASDTPPAEAGAVPATATGAEKPGAPKPPPWGRRATDTPDNASSIRVPAAKLDEFVNLIGELVTVQARLGQIATANDDSEVAAVSEEIERLTSSLRESSINIRMLPLRATFERFRRLVHDLSRDLHKEVDLTIEGADTELDKSVIDKLSDPLMHLIRNSMDHGIESAERRAAAGKRPVASVKLSARYSGASVLIAVSDDGGGINTQAVRNRAVEKGLVAADAQLSDSEIYGLIFAAGFSTAATITDVSGRGVGMDVVKRSVEALRGTIDVVSKPGAGTTITLRLPLTLAIIDGLLVRVGTAHFVLPVGSTLECIELSRADIARANGKHVAEVRGELIPYIRIREYFNIRSEMPEREQIMITETEDGRYGLVVDQVLGDHQTVIKNLGRVFRDVQEISGATILGDGSVALIIDPQRLIRDAVQSLAVGAGGEGHTARLPGAGRGTVTPRSEPDPNIEERKPC